MQDLKTSELERAVAYWRGKAARAERHKFMNPGMEYRSPRFYDNMIATYEKNLEVAMENLNRRLLSSPDLDRANL